MDQTARNTANSKITVGTHYTAIGITSAQANSWVEFTPAMIKIPGNPNVLALFPLAVASSNGSTDDIYFLGSANSAANFRVWYPRASTLYIRFIYFYK